MSQVIDERILKMQFDNKQFEENVQTSMSTLDKLKQKLNLSGASKGLEEVNNAARRISFSGLNSGIETVQAKFSALQVMGITTLANLTNSAVNAGKRIASALTIDPIKTGFQEYETQINAVQTILANTSSKGTTLGDVNGALDKLNAYADKTIYNFTEMTRNIGTFTAAGVDLDKSVSAIQGIANLAAVSGSTSQQASTAMYQLSQALAAGRVNLQDWNSVVNAGMGGQVFQDALKRTAKVMGKDVDGAIKKYGSFRESLSKGEWLTTDVLTKTLEQFTMAAKEGSTEWNKFKKSLMAEGYTEKQATEILKMANTATDAATKVKTFTQLWDTLKEAAQSGWTQTWELIVGDFEQAKKMLTGISDTVGEMINASSKSRNDMLTGALTSNWDKLIGKINDAGISTSDFEKQLKKTCKKNQIDFDALIEEYGSVEEAFRRGDTFSKDILKKTIASLDKSAADLSKVKKKLQKGMTGKDVTEAQKALNALGYDLGKADGVYGNATEKAVKAFQKAKKLKVTGIIDNKTLKALEKGTKSTKNLSKSCADLISTVDELGGRELLIEAFKNVFSGLLDILKPIKEAFQEVFPPVTSDQLFNFIDGFHSLTTAFKDFTSKHSDNIKSAFHGIFSVIDVGWTFIKKLGSAFVDIIARFTGFSGSILDAAGSLGEWLTNISESIKESNALSDGIDWVVDKIGKGIDKVKSFGTAIKDAFENNKFEGFLNFFKNLWGMIKNVGSSVAKVLSPITETILGLFRNSSLFDILNSGLLAGGFLGIGKMAGGLEGFKEIFEKLIEKKESGGLMDSIKESLGGLLETFTSYQNNLNAQTLSKIAIAIGILTASIFVLSSIDADSLYSGLTAVTVLFGELIGAMKLFDTMGLGLKGAGKAVLFMIGLSVALGILAAAMKSISDMSWSELVKGLTGVAGGMVVLVGALNLLPRNTSTTFKSLFTSFKSSSGAGNFISAGIGMIALAGAIKILASAMKDISGMSWEEIGKGLVGIAGALGALVVAMNLMPKNMSGNISKGMIGMGIGMIALATAMKILASAMKDISGMSWEEIGKGLTGVAGALIAITTAVNFMPKNMVGIGVGLIAISTAMVILASAIGKMGGMSWEEIGRGMTVLGGAMYILAIGLNLMTGTLGGSAALLVATAALALMVPVLLALGSMSWGTIVKGLVTLAGAFTIMGVAGVVLSPLIPVILALSGAMALFGIGVLAMGAGVTALAIGFTALVTAISAGATAFVAGLTVVISGILTMLPTVATELARAIITFCQVIGEGAPKIIEALASIIVSLAKALVEAIPVIVDAVLTLVTSLLNALTEHMPELLDAATNLIVAFVEGLNNNLPKLIQAAFDLIINFIDGLATAIEENAPKLAEAVKKLIVAIIKAGISLLDEAVNTFKEAGSAIMNSGLVQGIISKASAVITGIGNIIKKAYNAVTGFIGNFLSAGKNLIVKMGEGIKNAASRVKNACVDAVKSAKTAITNKISEWTTIGKNIIEGLKNGIVNAAKGVVSAAKGVISDAIEGAKNLLKINSPSKVFMSMGMSIDEGLVVGINKMASSVTSTTKKVGSSAIGAMSDTLSNLSDIANSVFNGETQPTIRPVLDLSNIESGAGAIDGMFRMTPSVGLLSRVGSLNSMMNGYGQNGGNDDVVSAINKLRKDLGNVGGNVTNINGITYNDDGPINDAIGALVRAVMIEGRV